MPEQGAEGPLEPPYLSDLLVVLHATAVAWQRSERVLWRSWAHHLMEDWRSLELLAERYRKTPPV
jgi:hypothetical protein